MHNIFHIILTRFNTRISTRFDPHAISPEWLGTRMRLFRDVTFPSVASQSRLPDAWLVFFDENTPEATRDEFHQLAATLPLMRAEYFGDFNADMWGPRIRRIIPPDADWLLTTGLDSDDGLNRCFIESVQYRARQCDCKFINPTMGLIVADGRLYRKRDFSSAFMTFSEPAAGCRTVWLDIHTRVGRHGPVEQLGLPDAWIQVVHGGNLLNRTRGVRISPTKVSPDALPQALLESVTDVTRGALLLDNSLGLLRRYARSAWRRGCRVWSDRPTWLGGSQ